MNKKSIFAVALFSALIGGGASYFVADALAKTQTKTTFVEKVKDDAPVHFTSETASVDYPDLTYAAEKTVPTVVGIENIQRVKSSNQYYGGGSYDPFLELFGFRNRQQQPQQQQESKRAVSGGSGVIISDDGYIVTNNHVIENADELTVKLSNDTKYKAKLIGTDPTTDIALIKIDAEDLPYTKFGDSDKLRLGQWVIAVGNPYSLTSTVTAGIVSAKGRNLDVIPSQFRIESFIQTDAAVNPGNSGGALVNDRGELVGINTVIKSPTGSYTGYSFAVPSSIVQKIIVDLREYGIVQRAMLGVSYMEITPELFDEKGDELDITEKSGLYIGTVSEEGAAEAAGVKKGDVLVQFNGVDIHTSSALQEQIAKYRPGDKVEIAVKRDGSVKHFDVVLRNRVGEEKLLAKNSVDMVSFLGGEFADVSSKTAKSLDINGGVQVVKITNGLLANAGIREGYIITAINGKEVEEVSDLERITEKVKIIDGVYPNGRYISYSIVSQ